MITEAMTDADRQSAQALFQTCFVGISPNAVPMSSRDGSYAPIVAKYTDGAGRLIGAALTCRAEVTMRLTGYASVLDKHSELDLMAVAPGARGNGVGTQLIAHLEGRLRERGVRVWFGNVTADLEVERLRKFYSRHGFTVLPNGQSLPPMLGKALWSMPRAERPAFYFYKSLTRLH